MLTLIKATKLNVLVDEAVLCTVLEVWPLQSHNFQHWSGRCHGKVGTARPERHSVSILNAGIGIGSILVQEGRYLTVPTD